jgi:hypothetical protein
MKWQEASLLLSHHLNIEAIEAENVFTTLMVRICSSLSQICKKIA